MCCRWSRLSSGDGLIFLGWATPTESAALGALGPSAWPPFREVQYAHGRQVRHVDDKNGRMVLIIIACAQTYSQIVSFSGISKSVAAWVVGLNLSAIPSFC